MIATLGHSCHVSGRNDEADRHYADALTRSERLGQGRNANSVALLNNWALVNEGAGELAKALSLYDRALDIVATDTPDAPRPPAIVVNRARTLELMGRLPEASQAYEDARELACAQGVPPAEQYALLGLASLALERGDLDAAATCLARSAEGPQSPPTGKVGLMRQQVEARLAMIEGDPDRAAERYTGLVGARPPLASTVAGLLGRSEAHRAAGRIDAALADASDALELARTLQGTKSHSFRTDLAALAKARLLQEKSEPRAVNPPCRDCPPSPRSSGR